MGLSQLWNDASSFLLQSAEPAVQPAVAPRELDAQDLFGNAFLASSLFGGQDEEGSALRDLVQQTREAIEHEIVADQLRDKLHVGEGAQEGQASVSQEEFDEMVQLYSDIRKGKTQLQWDTSSFGKDKDAAEAFKNGTMEDLSKIMQTPSGRAMLKELAHNERGTKVRLGPSDDPNAPGTSPLHGGRTFDQLDTEERWALDRAIREGKPLDTAVNYTPGYTVHTDKDGDITSDVTLYHELVHAWHFGKGDTVKGGKDTGDHVVENSELQTTQGWHGDEDYTENRYRWERRQLGEDVPRRETYGGRDVDEGPRDRKCPAW